MEVSMRGSSINRWFSRKLIDYWRVSPSFAQKGYQLNMFQLLFLWNWDLETPSYVVSPSYKLNYMHHYHWVWIYHHKPWLKNEVQTNLVNCGAPQIAMWNDIQVFRMLQLLVGPVDRASSLICNTLPRQTLTVSGSLSWQLHGIQLYATLHIRIYIYLLDVYACVHVCMYLCIQVSQ